MKKPCTSLIILLLLSAYYYSFAQTTKTTASSNGYNIIIDTKNAKGEIMTIAYYEGTYSNPKILDSVVIEADQQQMKFVNNKKIIGGIYQLAFKVAGKNEKYNNINIAVDNGAQLKFTLDGTVIFLIQTDQSLNKDFIALQRNVENIAVKQTILWALRKKYPQSAAALFAKLELKKMKPAETTGKIETRNRFLDSLDLQDKHIPLLPNAYSFLLQYMQALPVTSENYIDNADRLLKGMTCSSRNYGFYLDWMFKNLKYFQEKYKLESAYRYLYNRYLDNDSCKEINAKLYTRISAEIRELGQLPTGSVIPEFSMQDSAGTVYNIKEIVAKSEYTFLAFFDPDCSHCQETMPDVTRFFNVENFGGRIQKISFLNVMDTLNWQKFLHNSNLEDWMNVKPNNHNMQYQSTLKIYSNPVFILLDNKGTVIAKGFNEDALRKVLRKS